MKSDRPVYVLALQPLPGVDGVRMLRQALKVLKRRFGLKVVTITQPFSQPAPTDQTRDHQAAVQPRLAAGVGGKPLVAFLQTNADHFRIRSFLAAVYEGTGSTLVGSPIYDPSRSARPTAF
jgi:hypothetical protein